MKNDNGKKLYRAYWAAEKEQGRRHTPWQQLKAEARAHWGAVAASYESSK